MKLFFRIFLVVAFALASINSASAQTKEFLEKFDMIKYQSSIPRSVYEGVEIIQYPADMLRAMGVNDISGNSRNVLNNLKVIYQIKIPLDNRNNGNNIYRGFTLLVSGSRKPKLYEQIMCNTGRTQEVTICKAIRKKNNQPDEFMILMRNKEKAIICDIVGYIRLDDVLTMLSPELKGQTTIDSLSISNK